MRPGRLDTVLTEVARLLASLPEIAEAMIVLLDERGRTRAITKSGWKDYTGAEEAERLLQRVVRQVQTNGMPLVSRSVPGRATGTGESASVNKSLIAVPISGDWGAIGAVLVEREGLAADPADQTLSEEISFLNIVACLVAQTVALRRATGADRSALAPAAASQEQTGERALQSAALPDRRVCLVHRSKQPGPVDRQRLIDAMERAGWVQAKAARLLGVTVRQMRYALRKHEIEIKRF
jgi:transcriptional regulator with GAF, ATPase, and Fis domain